jgi:hypothetical protein
VRRDLLAWLVGAAALLAVPLVVRNTFFLRPNRSTIQAEMTVPTTPTVERPPASPFCLI